MIDSRLWKTRVQNLQFCLLLSLKSNFQFMQVKLVPLMNSKLAAI